MNINELIKECDNPVLLQDKNELKSFLDKVIQYFTSEKDLSFNDREIDSINLDLFYLNCLNDMFDDLGEVLSTIYDILHSHYEHFKKAINQ